MNWYRTYTRYNVYDFAQINKVVEEMQRQGYVFLKGYYKRKWPLFWIKNYTLIFEAPPEMQGIINGTVKITVS